MVNAYPSSMVKPSCMLAATTRLANNSGRRTGTFSGLTNRETSTRHLSRGTAWSRVGPGARGRELTRLGMAHELVMLGDRKAMPLTVRAQWGLPAIVLASVWAALGGCSSCQERDGARAVDVSDTPRSVLADSQVRRDLTSESSSRLVGALGDPALDVGARYRVLEVLEARGDHETIDAVIGAYEDKRVFDPNYDGWQIPPPNGDDSITVGRMCRGLARRLIFGCTNRGFNLIKIEDWWAQHRHLPMDEIRRLALEADRRASEPLPST